METTNECLACGTMTDRTDRLCSEACLEAMYDSIKIEEVYCDYYGCSNLASHKIQGVGDTLSDTCGEHCKGCEEVGCDYDFSAQDCNCEGYCAPDDHTPNAEGVTTAGLAKLLFG